MSTPQQPPSLEAELRSTRRRLWTGERLLSQREKEPVASGRPEWLRIDGLLEVDDEGALSFHQDVSYNVKQSAGAAEFVSVEAPDRYPFIVAVKRIEVIVTVKGRWPFGYEDPATGSRFVGAFRTDGFSPDNYVNVTGDGPEPAPELLSPEFDHLQSGADLIELGVGDRLTFALRTTSDNVVGCHWTLGVVILDPAKLFVPEGGGG